MMYVFEFHFTVAGSGQCNRRNVSLALLIIVCCTQSIFFFSLGISIYLIIVIQTFESERKMMLHLFVVVGCCF